MILTVDEVMDLPEFSDMPECKIKEKLTAIELMIRAYTHNNFQNRTVRFTAGSLDGVLLGSSRYLKAGDTIQISQSLINDGLYVVEAVKDNTIEVDGELYDNEENLITKVVYPADVKAGVFELAKYSVKMSDKAGIKSETLSRYSVTYADTDGSNQVMGYPAAMLGFLAPYMKARF